MNSKSITRRLTAILAVMVLLLALVTPALAQRRGFGGGGGFGRSGGFGGGGFSRSSGSGSFGGFGSRSSSSAPPSSGNFGSGSSGWSRQPGSSSFGRSGSFGSSGRINSTSINGRTYTAPPGYSDFSFGRPVYINQGGSSIPAFAGGFLGGYSLGMLSSPWTHWMPFHPAFYMDPPTYYNGAYYGGGFSFTRLIIGALIIWVVWRFIRKAFGGGSGGSRNIKYTQM